MTENGGLKGSDVREAAHTVAESIEAALIGQDRGEALTLVDVGAQIASALRLLGNADAATPMGAIEGLGLVLKEGAEELAGALHAVAAAIQNVADARENSDA